MKPTDTQIAIINSIIGIIDTWKNTDDITSPIHYAGIEELLDANLTDIVSPKQIECIKNEVTKLFDRIKRND